MADVYGAGAVSSSAGDVRGAHVGLSAGDRRRSIGVLFGGVALSATGYIAAITVGTLAGEDLGGTAAWAGVPTACAVAGTAAGAALLAWLSGRYGRRPALAVGYLSGAIGATLAAASLVLGSLPLLLVAMLVIGLPNAAAQLARYVGGDMFDSVQRARAIGIVVWGATVGAIVGPNLIGPTGSIASGFGVSPLAGAFLLAAAVFGAAGVVSHILLRRIVVEVSEAIARDGTPTQRGMRDLLRRPNVSVAVVTLVGGQLIMVMVMTMTPIHLRDHGQDLSVVGLVMSAHTLGMFALSPVSGWLTAHLGSLPVAMGGFALLAVASVLAALAPASGGPALAAALFLLGFGWSLGFVAGSTLLAGGMSLAPRARLQGTVDAAVWGTSAISSLVAGTLVDAVGYAGLGLLAAALTTLPALLLIARRGALATHAA